MLHKLIGSVQPVGAAEILAAPEAFDEEKMLKAGRSKGVGVSLTLTIICRRN